MKNRLMLYFVKQSLGAVPGRVVCLQEQVLLDQSADRRPGRVLTAQVWLHTHTHTDQELNPGQRAPGAGLETHQSEGFVTQRLGLRLQLQFEHVAFTALHLETQTGFQKVTAVPQMCPLQNFTRSRNLFKAVYGWISVLNKS